MASRVGSHLSDGHRTACEVTGSVPDRSLAAPRSGTGFTRGVRLSNLDLPMLADYLPIAGMFLLAVIFVGVSMLVSRLFAPNRPTPEKLAPYECGILPETEAAQRFPVKFYLVAMLFVIFDVEIIFLFAWASRFNDLGWFGIGAILIFSFFVLETLMYVWKRGALDWNVKRRARYVPDSSQEAA